MMKVKTVAVVTTKGPDLYMDADFFIEDEVLVIIHDDMHLCYPIHNVIFYQFTPEELK